LERVRIAAPGGSYDVVIGPGLIAEAGRLLPELPGTERAFVVADRSVADRWLEPLSRGLEPRGLGMVFLAVPSGEEAKSLPVYGALVHQLATQEAHRDDVVVGLGGGAVGDLAGFVASTFMRGLPLVQIPTTLTAQVDAAVGGKTGVNLPEGKNLVGTFYQPRMVLCDTTTLSSLAERDFRSGLAEVAKYALAVDPDLLAELERDPRAVIAREPEALERLVARCVAAKGRVVAGDERDHGTRLHLNYGHTLGHALERLDSFSGRTHGEAVATGMVFAARLAEARGLARDRDLTGRTVRLLSALGLEPGGTLPATDRVLAAFRMDKKWSGGARFVLLEDVGRPVVVNDVPDDEIQGILRAMGATG
jgi:3-dehydroquinate synthase